MFSTSASPRLLRNMAYITSITIPEDDDAINLKTLKIILQRCINLRTLVSGDLPESAFGITPPSSLKALGFMDDLSASPLHDTEVFPLFRGITHAVIETNEFNCGHVQASGLTHVYTGCYSTRAPPWTAPLLPQLQLYLVYFQPFMPKTGADFYTKISESQFDDIQYRGKVDRRFVLVVHPSRAMWPGRETCGGFLVAPDWEAGMPMTKSSRKKLYSWLEDEAWTEGEKIVKQREW
ncbi:hypothetical protein DL96DRAFT_1639380 [Flagelloscypha sp. PMI_526]|nr:hypothetical protein DL96DRAFT_1639380 [Flagelloscypha sp. PMI_526]